MRRYDWISKIKIYKKRRKKECTSKLLHSYLLDEEPMNNIVKLLLSMGIDKTVQDNTVEDKTVEDKIDITSLIALLKHNTVEDKTVEDKTVQDKIDITSLIALLKDKTVEDKTPLIAPLQDKTVEDITPLTALLQKETIEEILSVEDAVIYIGDYNLRVLQKIIDIEKMYDYDSLEIDDEINKQLPIVTEFTVNSFDWIDYPDWITRESTEMSTSFLILDEILKSTKNILLRNLIIKYNVNCFKYTNIKYNLEETDNEAYQKLMIELRHKIENILTDFEN